VTLTPQRQRQGHHAPRARTGLALDAALHPVDNRNVFAPNVRRAGPQEIATPVGWARTRKHGNLIPRSSRSCFLNGNAGVCSDIAVTCALDETHARHTARRKASRA
jgi:hypothetical protein